jgi:bacteriocin biosynthesis cyclodehydratase domain-containing protein
MLKRPRFKESYRVELLQGQGLFLLSEDDFSILTGEMYEKVGPCLTGHDTVAEIIEKLAGEVDPAVVYYAVMQLEDKGYVTEGAHGRCAEADAAFWHLSGAAPLDAEARLSQSRIAVIAAGDLEPDLLDRMTTLLRDRGLRLADAAAEADLTIVLTNDYLAAELADYNRRFSAEGRAWLLVRPIGIESWIGPLFEDRETACWNCLAQRLSGHKVAETFLYRSKTLKNVPATAKAATAASMTAALALAVEEAARIIAGMPRTRNRVLCLDHRKLEISSHLLVKRPQCAHCGDAAIKSVRPVTLAACPRVHDGDGGHRSVSAEEMVERFKHHVSPITGIIRELTSRRSADDHVKHIYSAGHNFAMMIEDMSFLRATLRMGSGGKGRTDIQAKASAIGEALERYSGLFQGDEPRRSARLEDLGDDVIDPRNYLLFSERQFAEKQAWNKTHDRYQFVPLPFDATAVTEWTPLWSLTHRKPKYLPTACCYYGYNHHPSVRGAKLQSGFAYADSNGCAAGNTIEEAIFQGLLELIERDSVASWWYTRCRRPAVDLEGFREPYFDRMAGHYAGLGRKLWVLDVTNDIGVPSFVAVSYRVDAGQQEIIWGCGAHTDCRIGITRALTEVNQFLAAFESFSRLEDRYTGFDPEAVRWFKGALIEEQDYLLPSESLPRRATRDFPVFADGDIRDELSACIARIEELGHEVLVLDQTREDVGLPVARVVAPGLRHFFARFAPGRLYDVPAKLGWVPRRLAEHELNPIPVFF